MEGPQKNGPALWDPTESKDSVNSEAAPKPVGAYPHARRVGDLLYLSGVGPRQPGTNAIPGGPIHDAKMENPSIMTLKHKLKRSSTTLHGFLKKREGQLTMFSM